MRRSATKTASLMCWLCCAAALGGAGCENDIDPDSLVRELRVLAMRIGDAAPASSAELQAQVTLAGGMPDLMFTQDSVRMAALLGAPTGPGRRIAAPRPLVYDWYLCIGVRSLFSPGTLDPECRKFGPGDPAPRDNPALMYLQSGGAEITIPSAMLKGVLGTSLQTLLNAGGSGGTGTGTGMLPTRPVTLLLPVMLQVRVDGGDPKDNRDSEIAYNFLRVIVALPGMALPPPNRNPTLQNMVISFAEGAANQDMTPCPETGACQSTELVGDQGAYLIAHATETSLEVYVPLDDSGRGNTTETMRYSWFSSDGKFSEERTGDMMPINKYDNIEPFQAPPGVAAIQVWIVVQDERGGADFQRYELTLP